MKQFGSIEKVITAMLREAPVSTKEIRERVIKTLGRTPKYISEYSGTLMRMVEQGKVIRDWDEEGYCIYTLA